MSMATTRPRISCSGVTVRLLGSLAVSFLLATLASVAMASTPSAVPAAVAAQRLHHLNFPVRRPSSVQYLQRGLELTYSVSSEIGKGAMRKTLSLFCDNFNSTMQIFRTQIFRVAAIMALTIIGFFVVVNVEPRMYLVIPAILIAAILIQ